MTRALLCFQQTSYRPDAYVAAAVEEGVELVLATGQRAAAVRFGLPVYQVAFASTAEAERLCEALRRDFGEPPLDGVVAADEASAAFAARVATALDLPFHSVAGVDAARDKRLLRGRLRAADVPVPDWRQLKADADVAVLPVTFPCVVKPSMLSGSQGVIRADDGAALQQAVEVSRGIVRHHGSPLKTLEGFDELLLEEYVDGPEVALEGLMQNGALQLLAIFDKPDPLVGPYFEETLYVAPSRHPGPWQAQLANTVERACVALGLCDGPVHAELRIAAAGPMIIEVAARSIGGLCSRVLAPCLGSLERRILRCALRREALPLVAGAPAVGVMMLPVAQNGVLRGVAGVAEAAALPHIDGVTISIEPGETALMLPHGNRYLGFVFAHAPTPAEVEGALRGAHALLRFEWKRLLRQVC